MLQKYETNNHGLAMHFFFFLREMIFDNFFLNNLKLDILNRTMKFTQHKQCQEKMVFDNLKGKVKSR